MNHPTPPQLRRAIVRLQQTGKTYAQIAELLEIGEATVSRVLRLHRESGSVEPKAPGGGNRSPIHGETASLLERIVQQLPDATVEELADELIAKTGIQTSRSGVMRALGRLGYSRKKSPSLRPNETRRKTLSVVAFSRSSSPR